MNMEEYNNTNYSFEEIEVDPRFKICEKEMKICFIVQILYTLLTIGIAYFIGRGDPKDYTYVMGVPAWWFSVILSSIIFMGIVIYITKVIFVDMDLTDEGTIEKKKSA